MMEMDFEQNEQVGMLPNKQFDLDNARKDLASLRTEIAECMSKELHLRSILEDVKIAIMNESPLKIGNKVKCKRFPNKLFAIHSIRVTNNGDWIYSLAELNKDGSVSKRAYTDGEFNLEELEYDR